MFRYTQAYGYCVFYQNPKINFMGRWSRVREKDINFFLFRISQKNNKLCYHLHHPFLQHTPFHQITQQIPRLSSNRKKTFVNCFFVKINNFFTAALFLCQLLIITIKISHKNLESYLSLLLSSPYK